jgi:hypothetical protein
MKNEQDDGVSEDAEGFKLAHLRDTHIWRISRDRSRR